MYVKWEKSQVTKISAAPYYRFWRSLQSNNRLHRSFPEDQIISSSWPSCVSSRFPKAIPLQNILAKNVVKTNFFTKVGLPKVIQSDQGSNFMSKLFQQIVKQLGITSMKASDHHPQTLIYILFRWHERMGQGYSVLNICSPQISKGIPRF